MQNDPEQQLYGDVADLIEKVPKLQNETTTLKAKFTKLSNRVESLELMAFQDQISKLDDKVNSVNEGMLSISRTLADFEMDFMQYHMKHVAQTRLQGSTRERVKEQIAS